MKKSIKKQRGASEAKKSDNYNIAVKPQKDNWAELSPMIVFSAEIRRMIYTINTIESYDRQLSMVSVSKGLFELDDSLLKRLYLTNIKKV